MIDVYKSVGLLSLFYSKVLLFGFIYNTFCDQNFQKQVLLFDLICLLLLATHQ